MAIVAIGQAIHLDQPLHRWNELSARIPKDARWLATTASLPAIRDAGWFGFGPGTFRVIFPHYLKQIGAETQGGWRFLHQDYLQTVLEWGWIGAALWSVYFFVGIVIEIQNLRSSRAAEWIPRYRSFLPLALLALAGVALHALVDFPLQIASLQLYVATYLGVCWGSGKWGEKRRAE